MEPAERSEADMPTMYAIWGVLEEDTYEEDVGEEYGCPCDDCVNSGEESDGDSDEPHAYW